jgi:hypothetical protein
VEMARAAREGSMVKTIKVRTHVFGDEVVQ